MKTRVGIVGALLIVASSGWAARPGMASEMFVPDLFDGREGNSNNLYPFGNKLGASRVQQVFDASIFGDREEPFYIQSLAFRRDLNVAFYEGPLAVEVPEMTIALSTTAKPIDGLSPVFAENIGADEVIAYQGRLPLSGGRRVDSPSPFDVVVNLQEPFLFDPTKGNLLVDFLDLHSSRIPERDVVLDAEERLGDPVSRVLGYINTGWSENPYESESLSRDNPAARGNPDTVGVATAFRIGGPIVLPQPELPVPTPEPATWVTFGLLGVGLIGRARSKARRARPDDARP